MKIPLLLFLLVACVTAQQPNEYKVENRARRIIEGEVWEIRSARFINVYLRSPEEAENGILATARTSTIQKTGASITTQINQKQSRTHAETEEVWSDGEPIFLKNCVISDIMYDREVGEFYVRAFPSKSKTVIVGEESVMAFDLGIPEISSVYISFVKGRETDSLPSHPELKKSTNLQKLVQQPHVPRPTAKSTRKRDIAFDWTPREEIVVDWTPMERLILVDSTTFGFE